MKQYYILFLLLCFSSILHAQYQKEKPALHSVNSIGITDGSKGVGFLLQSVLGVSLRRSFAGIGAGIDDYNLRSVPLFLDLRQEFGRKNRHVFLYADGGYNFDWLTDKDHEQQSLYEPGDYRGGIYYDAGLGYRIHLKSKDALLFSAGYTYKELHVLTSQLICISGNCSVVPATVNYHMPRLSVKAGFQF